MVALVLGFSTITSHSAFFVASLSFTALPNCPVPNNCGGKQRKHCQQPEIVCGTGALSALFILVVEGNQDPEHNA